MSPLHSRLNSFLIVCLILLGGFGHSAFSQSRSSQPGTMRMAQSSGTKMFTMRDAVMGGYGPLRPTTLHKLTFRPDTEDYSYVKGDTMVVAPLAGGDNIMSLTLTSLNRTLRGMRLDTMASFPTYKWYDNSTIVFWDGQQQLFYSLETGIANKGFMIPKGADNVHVSPDDRAMTYNVGEAIYLKQGATAEEVVSGDIEGVVNGRAVHRNEFGINDGIFWSPTSQAFAFYQMDESMVTEYPLVDALKRTAKPEMIRYPMAGMTSHQVKVGVYWLDTKQITWLKTGQPLDHYLTNIAWTPNGQNLLIAEINRGTDTLKMNEYDARNGQLLQMIFEETDPHYVDPQQPAKFVPGKEDMFVWESQRNGHNHLYLYQIGSKKAPKRITSGNWDVITFHGFDKKGKTIYVTTTEHDPIGRQLVAIDIKSGNRKRLTQKEGYNYTIIDPVSERYIAYWSAFDQPGGVYTGSLKGGKIRELYLAENPLKDFKMPEVEIVKLKAADGRTTLYGRLIKPLDYDPNKKYPAVIYVYGGPHAQLVTNRWLAGAPLWEYLMAQRGYMMFVLDNRGSGNRGMRFEQAIHRQLGEVEMADQMKGVEFLKRQRGVDSTRIGVHGWSFGGFMTMSLLLRQGDTFKVGVAGGPVIDWKYYEVMYGERYMDTPQENREGYERANLCNYVDNLEGKRLLLIHGYQDPTVVPQNTLVFLKACVDHNRPEVDYFLYPGHGHNVRGSDRVHLMDKVTLYFDTFLKIPACRLAE